MPLDAISSSGSTGTPPADRISSRAEGLNRADFLKMLTAQLQAQDPLNPLDSQDFASQLATFSSLQELQSIGATLDQSLQTNLIMTQSFSNAMAATLIGRTIRADSNQITVSGTGAITLNYQLSAAAVEGSIEILNAEGQLVRTLPFNAQASGDQHIEWDGRDAEGRQVPEGQYTFRVRATDADGRAVPVSTYFEGRVEEVRYDNGIVLLRVGDREFTLSQVLSIREGDNGGRSGERGYRV